MHRSLVFILALTACGTSAEVSAPDTPEAHRKVTEIPDRLTKVVLAPEEEAPRPSPKLFSEYAEPTDIDSPFGHIGDDDGLTDSIGGLIGAKGTRVGTGGLGSGGSLGIKGGAAYGGSAEGLGGLGTKGIGSGASGYGGGGAVGYGSSGGTVGRGGGSGSPRAMVDYTPAPRQPLRAGSTDDNADFDGFLTYLDTERSHGRLARVDAIDLRDRTTLRVLDSVGEPVPSASVTVLNDGQVVWRGETYGDGRLPYYPHQLGDAVTRVEVSHAGAKASAKWDGASELTMTLDAPADEVVRLDVGLILDTTGSMADELAAIKASLAEVTERLKADDRAVDIRFGAVLYRDHGDRYVTQAHAFTDLERFESVLAGAEANGGGDMPEAMHEALEIGIDKLAWREDAARVAFVIADAPPQLHNGRPHGLSALDALSKGIRVHAVAASGLDPMGSLVMRRVAQLTRGKFIFIEYGGDLAGSAAAHGVKGQLESNNLDDILYKELKAEMDGWGTWTL